MSGLKPCRACGSACRVETFSGPYIEGTVTLWVCANHERYDGDCSSTTAYLYEDAWNTRPDAVAALDAMAGALERIAQYDVGLQGLREDGEDTPEKVAAYYASQVERRRNIAREALASYREVKP